MCECEREEQFTAVGVQFEARDIDKFLAAFERAQRVIEALGQEVTVTAQAMERLGRANRSVRRTLIPISPWRGWLRRLFHRDREDTP